MSSKFKIQNSKLEISICLALALVTFGVFWQIHSHEFLNYDDMKFVTLNPHVTGGLSAESIKWAFSSSPEYYWRPLTWLSLMLDCQLFGLKACYHHLTSLALHLASTILLFIALKR